MAHKHKGPAEQGHAAHGYDKYAPGADKLPAFLGLILGGIALFLILFGVVKITQSRQASEGHEGGAKPAAAAQH